jgi:hypothetical protein
MRSIPRRSPFRALIDDLARSAKTGLWLRPFRGIPEARNLPRFDLIYLDENEIVIKGTELFSVREFSPFSGRVASALALPPNAISSSHTQAGDQLKIALADDEDMVRWLAPRPGPRTIPALEPIKEQQGEPLSAGGISSPSLPANVESARQPERKRSLWARIRSWINEESQRAERRELRGLVVYYWTGGAPQSYRLGNISHTGMFLLTDERWVLGTIIQMRLQRTDMKEDEDTDGSVSVLAQVVRWAWMVWGFSLCFLTPRIRKAEL